MAAIVVKYQGPTNTRGARMRATMTYGAINQSISTHYQSEHSTRQNAAHAAMILVRLYIDKAVPNNWECAELPNGDYVFVMQGEQFTRYFTL